MSTYTTISGDTFDKVARKIYGDDKKAAPIRTANPGVFEPMVGGLTLKIPPIPFLDSPSVPVDTTDPDETQVRIEGQRFRYWTSIRWTSHIDQFGSVQFFAPYEPEQKSFRDTFVPLDEKSIEIHVGGELVQRSFMMVVPGASDVQTNIFAVPGISQVGITSRCTMPIESYPMEFKNQNLEQIARKMLEPWGFGVIFEDDPGPAFEKVRAEPTRNVWPFLAKLARQRGLIISDTPQSNMKFWKSVDLGVPVAILTEGQSPLINVMPSIRPESFYSDITGIKRVRRGSRGSSHTVRNPHLDAIRPHNFVTPDAKGADAKTAAEAKTGRMFGSVVEYRVRLATWRDPLGALWQPNTLIRLQAPGSMIYQPYTFLIRAVEFSRDANTSTATLRLVPPGAYSGKIPKVMPWE
jgi:prophage tail gpP-like protein